MDFTHTPYFAGAQPYQFIGIPPLTPSHSNSVASEDFNTTSPPVGRTPLRVLRLQKKGKQTGAFEWTPLVIYTGRCLPVPQSDVRSVTPHRKPISALRGISKQ